MSVHSGPKRAVMELQKIIGFTGNDVDGLMGMKTLEAIKEYDVEDLIVNYNFARLEFVKSLKTWSTFGKGWSNRIMGASLGYQATDMGVIDRSVMMHRGAGIVPAPNLVGEGKALEKDEKETSIISKVFSDPVAILPVLGTVISPLADFNNYVQGALAFTIVATVVYALVRAFKKSE